MTSNATHPVTHPDGTCSDLTCPCHKWSHQAAANVVANVTTELCSPSPSVCFDCGQSFHSRDCQQADRPTDFTAPTFDNEWERAPQWTKRTTERETAEYWVEVGRRMEREAGLKAQNEDLREMKRMIEGRELKTKGNLT